METYAANQNKNIVKSRKYCPKFGEIIKKDIAKICNVVLLFARRLTSIGLLPIDSVMNCLIEEITTSLNIIIRDGSSKKTLLEYDMR